MNARTIQPGDLVQDIYDDGVTYQVVTLSGDGFMAFCRQHSQFSKRSDRHVALLVSKLAKVNPLPQIHIKTGAPS